MSAIYSSGNQFSANAQITSTVRGSFLREGADGALYIDEPGLRAWLQGQFDSIASTDFTTNPNVAVDARNVDVNALIAPLTAVVKRENWIGKPGWPATSVSNQGEHIASLVKKLAELKTASQVLTDYFGKLLDADKLLLAAKGLLTLVDPDLPDVKQKITESRAYIQTFVTDWDEESAPGDPSPLVEMDQDDKTTVLLALPTPGRNINRWRLYRSNSGTSRASFQFVDEGPVSQTSYSDSKKAEVLQEVCPSTIWDEPPAKLRGLVGMPNGVLAGYFDNTVAFCESYFPYAWPVDYQITTEFPIVGLGVFGQTVFVGTRGQPYYISGADAASMSALKIDCNQSCVSARSIVSVQGGALFASPDGICMANQAGVSVVTGKHFTIEEWRALNPSSMHAVEHEGTYYFFYTAGSQGCYALHFPTGKLVKVELAATAAFVDRAADVMYTANGNTITATFLGTARRMGLWRSKLFTLPQQAPLAWLQVNSDYTAAVTVRVYASGALFHMVQLNDIEPVRMPPGRHLEWEVEIESQARVTSVTLASSTLELQQV